MATATLISQSSPDLTDRSTALKRLTDGDPELWADIVRTYRPCVLAQAARFGLDAWQRQDLEQRVWLALYEHAPKIRDIACLPGWLSTTARRAAIRLRYQHSRESMRGQVPEVSSAARNDIEEAFLVSESSAELQAAIAMLSPRQQAVVRALLDEVSYEEVSARLGIAMGSIGHTRQRALARLRRFLTPQMPLRPVG